MREQLGVVGRAVLLRAEKVAPPRKHGAGGTGKAVGGGAVRWLPLGFWMESRRLGSGLRSASP